MNPHRFSAKQRKEIARAFRRARYYLRRGTGLWRFICLVLKYDVYVGDPVGAAVVIRSRMGNPPLSYCHNSYSLEDWLAVQFGRKARSLYESPENMRRYRIHWLNALIKEFEA